MHSSINAIKKSEKKDQLFYANVHCDITQQPKVETVQVSISRLSCKPNVVCAHNGIWLDIKKDGSTNTCVHGEPWRQAECEEPVTKDKR